MRTRYFLILVIVVFFWMGCSSGQIYSVHSSEHKTYNKILIYADYPNLIQKNAYERALADEFVLRKVRVWRGIDVFPPLREYDSAYYATIQQSQGYEAILYLIPEGISTSTHSTAYKNWYGGISGDSHKEVDAVYSTIILIDAQTNQEVYHASLTSGAYLQGMARELADDLQKFGYLTSR